MRKPCKSGRHLWEEKSGHLQKCCNGYVPLKVPIKNAGYMKIETDEGNLDPWAGGTGATFVTIMVPDHETERIARLRACEPKELAKLWKGEPH